MDTDIIDEEELYIIQRKDMEKVCEINTESFKDDPYFNYQFNELTKEERIQFIHHMELGFTEQLIDFNNCFSFDSSFKCCALLLPPNKEWNYVYWEKFIENQSKKLISKGYKLTSDRIDLIEEFFAKRYTEHNVVDTYYLLTLSTNVEHRKKGLASKLLQQLFKRFDKEQKRCYIECSNDVNVQFYLKHGFTILSTAKLPQAIDENIPLSEVPSITFMHRIPKNIN